MCIGDIGLRRTKLPDPVTRTMLIGRRGFLGINETMIQVNECLLNSFLDSLENMNFSSLLWFVSLANWSWSCFWGVAFPPNGEQSRFPSCYREREPPAATDVEIYSDLEGTRDIEAGTWECIEYYAAKWVGKIRERKSQTMRRRPYRLLVGPSDHRVLLCPEVLVFSMLLSPDVGWVVFFVQSLLNWPALNRLFVPRNLEFSLTKVHSPKTSFQKENENERTRIGGRERS